jgi:hypothetical protein
MNITVLEQDATCFSAFFNVGMSTLAGAYDRTGIPHEMRHVIWAHPIGFQHPHKVCPFN